LAQIGDGEILRRLIADETHVKEGIPALVDRTSGSFLLAEGLQLDYKQQLRIESSSSVAEIARDILAFSNTEGGLLVVGVADDRAVIGHDAIDGRKLRDALGPYVGTRVTFDLDEVPVPSQGKTRRLVVLRIRRSLNAYPNLLRKEIELKPGFV
jgi:hypothetical protein